MTRTNLYRLALSALGVAAGIGAAACSTAEPPPPAGVVGRCRIVEVYDGDTLTVELSVRARVRLLDCWADEIRTTDDAEKARGLASRDHLAELCGMTWTGDRWTGSTPAYVAAPFSGERLGSLFTMGRLLGRVWALSGPDDDLATAQVAAGHAYRTKAELRAAEPREAPR